MASFIRKLKYIIPDRPGLRFNISCGTNTLREWLLSLRLLCSRNIKNNFSAIEKYEDLFARAAGVKYAYSFGAGRMALYAILEALGIEKNDEIIIPAFTCVVVPNAIIYRGARPVYVDIDSKTFNIDVNKIEAAITPKTKALYAQHTFGLPCDVIAIRRIADKYGLVVIEDGAHALGSRFNGALVGTLGDVAFFSTDHTKTISTHVGGMAVTNNTVLANKLQYIQESAPFLRSAVIRKILLTFAVEYVLFLPPFLWLGRAIQVAMIKLNVLFYLSDELSCEKPSSYPYPCRLSSSQAEIGISQLMGFAENVGHRGHITDYLESKIGWYKDSQQEIDESVMLRYSFLVSDRKEFVAHFQRFFDLGIWFTTVVHGRDYNLNFVGYSTGSCPVAEYVAEHIVNFPTHPRISVEILRREVELNWGWLEKQLVRKVEIVC
jgi:perosamine synthetase